MAAAAPAGGAGPAIVTPGDSTVRVFKVVVMGDGSSGKTSIVNRYAQESFGKQYKQTVGLDFYSKRLDLPGGVSCTLQIWDIGGQSIAGKMINNYIENADAVVLVYDLTNLNSFGNLNDWADLVEARFADAAKKPHVAVVGNKRDISHLRVVSQAAHEAFARSHGASHFLVSAKTGDGVALMFRHVVANLTGVRVTKAEAERLSTIVTAEVVDHADAPARPVPVKPKRGRKDGKQKSGVCALQ